MITAMPTRGTNTTASSYLKNKDIDAEWNKAKAESKKLTNEEREISENDQPVPADKTLDAKAPDLQKKAIQGTTIDNSSGTPEYTGKTGDTWNWDKTKPDLVS